MAPCTARTGISLRSLDVTIARLPFGSLVLSHLQRPRVGFEPSLRMSVGELGRTAAAGALLLSMCTHLAGFSSVYLLRPGRR